MRIVKIESESNGFHDNRMGNISYVPDGWAVIPENMKLPAMFPFVDNEVKNGIVTSMVAGIVPDAVESKPTVKQQIEALKQQLSSTDYKIIKCSEAQLLGEELPYDIASLHAERQALRDKINELEQQLESENNQEGGAI